MLTRSDFDFIDVASGLVRKPQTDAKTTKIIRHEKRKPSFVYPVVIPIEAKEYANWIALFACLVSVAVQVACVI